MYALCIDGDVTKDHSIGHYCNCTQKWPQSVSVSNVTDTDYTISNHLQQSLSLAKEPAQAIKVP